MAARHKARVHSVPEQHESVGECPACGKKIFTSKRIARLAIRRLYQGQRFRFYRCGQWWHATSQDAAVTARMRSREAS